MDPITIRHSTPGDRAALLRLAELDSARALRGDALLVESGGRLLAAVGVEDGRTIADPFERTADVVRLLALRAAQERRARGPARRSTWLSRIAPARGEEARA